MVTFPTKNFAQGKQYENKWLIGKIPRNRIWKRADGTITAESDPKAVGFLETTGYPPDVGILSSLKKINQNPNLYPSYSCSGMHDNRNRPYLGVVFASWGLVGFYALKIKSLGYHARGWDNGISGLDISTVSPVDKRGAMRFWADMAAILSKPPVP